ncbi:uncharacterized protein LOC126628165 isoform X2 [Malus sylvestris]|uniref:uncharacterized protein LOC126628165 isoform X2 n=1 Tax=Malus sylvestris TaxID=3752 RepID=UPI0021ACF10B|nr:uncharacterized protein LOC126628165 isoform X2 [Malus sylvestris]
MGVRLADIHLSQILRKAGALCTGIATFRNKLIDKWQRKTEVTTGAADIKSELHAFNRNISEQVASYIKDPSRMVGQMQMWKLAVAVFGTVPVGENTAKGKVTQSAAGAEVDGDPELLDDFELYQTTHHLLGLLYLKRLSA